MAATALRPQRPMQTLYLGLGVAAALLIVSHVPFGWYLLYPFTLFATWVHELGHALSGLLLGGHVFGVHINASASGDAVVTHFDSWRDGVVCACGLIAPPVVGAALITVARGPRRATIVLGFFALAIAVTTLIWVRSIFGGTVLAALALGLGYVAWKGGPRQRYFVAQFLGVELGLDWIGRIDYFFSSGFEEYGEHHISDAATVAKSFGFLPYFGWGALLAALSLAIVIGALALTFRRDSKV